MGRKASIKLHTRAKELGTESGLASGLGVPVDTAPRESPKPSDPPCGRIREQSRCRNEGRERRDTHETDEGNELRGGSGNMNDDEDNEINQVEHGRAGQVKRVDQSLTLTNQLIKHELIWYVRNLVKSQGLLEN